jgi:hypothetical protein
MSSTITQTTATRSEAIRRALNPAFKREEHNKQKKF